MIKGIDCASYQSETPSLRGMDFCFVKATEGTSYINPKQWAQADHARRAGLVVGFYHYLRPGNMAAQARYFVEKCASRHGDPLWADWEESGVSCRDKDAFLREVLRLRGDTHRVGLYCSQNYWLHHDTTSYCAEALWIANYNGKPGDPDIQHPWKFHQYTSSPIDTNVSTFRSRAALKAWADKKKGAKAPEEDALMAMSDRDWYDKVWRHDGVMQSPWGTKDNPTWKPESVMEQIGIEVKRLRDQVTGLEKKLDALDPAKLAADLEKVIESAKLRFEVPEA